jgi:phosphoribosylamine--glycine ligase
MKILVIGGGGREHALVWRLARDPDVHRVICAPGNPGIARVARIAAVPITDLAGVLALAQSEHVDLTVVGPELPLELGIVDLFHSHGLRIFGPSRAAAALECSKVFAKSFMARHGIPTARYRVCGDASDARAVVDGGELGFPVVVKADGLAGGKGVVVAPDRETAGAAIHSAMEARHFGDAGSRIVLEECLSGPEVSFFVVSDGSRALPLMSAQDHKRVFDGDRGPNTGGMGAFAPSPLVAAELQNEILRDIIDPVIAGMKAEGHQFRGFLYAGLMLTCDGPKVIEFNVRFGDPEAQVVLPMIESPLAPYLMSSAAGALDRTPIRFSAKKHVGVVIASDGYPGAVRSDLAIEGIDRAQQLEDVVVFHAGTREQNGQLVTAGGRVLTVVGRGATYQDAIARAYNGAGQIRFEGMQYRRDIGQRALRELPEMPELPKFQ